MNLPVPGCNRYAFGNSWQPSLGACALLRFPLSMSHLPKCHIRPCQLRPRRYRLSRPLSQSARFALDTAHRRLDATHTGDIIPGTEGVVGEQAEALSRAAAFEAHAEDWDRYTETPLGRLRQDLVTEHLLHHIRATPGPLMVLDAGGGTGGYAATLASLGHRVCLVDFAEHMLDIAQHKLARLDPGLLERVDLCCLAVEQLGDHFSGAHFQVVLAHTLLEYLDDPWEGLASLARLLAPEGLLSLLVVNPLAEPFQLAWIKRELVLAREALGQPMGRPDLFGLHRRVLPLNRARQALIESGVHVVAEYGIRIFADYFTSEELLEPAFYLQLRELEMTASRSEAYRQLARYLHIVGVKHADASAYQTESHPTITDHGGR